jgi:hypothetical protein
MSELLPKFLFLISSASTTHCAISLAFLWGQHESQLQYCPVMWLPVLAWLFNSFFFPFYLQKFC